MVNAPLLLLFMASWLKVFSPGPVIGPVAPLFAEERHASEEEATFVNSAVLGAEVAHSDGALVAAQRRILRSTERPRYLAVADMTLPSTAERLYIIDLQERRLVARMLVAHGQGSGELTCDRFSNREGSHATSKGLYRVGAEIVSPKHGPALLLHGLDEGQNCQALAREVIMHGADYVSADFIRSHGRLGRSWGCPAVPRQEMASIIELLADEGFLYVHGH